MCILQSDKGEYSGAIKMCQRCVYAICAVIRFEIALAADNRPTSFMWMTLRRTKIRNIIKNIYGFHLVFTSLKSASAVGCVSQFTVCFTFVYINIDI